MKWMGGWGPDEYDACPLSLRDEIIACINEEAVELERIRNQ